MASFRIRFEGTLLPEPMYAVDRIGRLDDFSEEAGVWLWRFTICCGIEKSTGLKRSSA